MTLFLKKILVAKKCDPALNFLILDTLKSKTPEECIIYVVITHIDICDNISYYLVISDTLKNQSVYTYSFCLERNIHTLFVWKGIILGNRSILFFLESNYCPFMLVVHANKIWKAMHYKYDLLYWDLGAQAPRCPT